MVEAGISKDPKYKRLTKQWTLEFHMKAQDASQAKMAKYMDKLSTGVISPYKDGKDVETLERVSPCVMMATTYYSIPLDHRIHPRLHPWLFPPRPWSRLCT
jgi:hypothetical protein